MRARRGTARTWLTRSAVLALLAVACAPMACGGGDDGSLFQNADAGEAGDDGSAPELDATFSGDRGRHRRQLHAEEVHRPRLHVREEPRRLRRGHRLRHVHQPAVLRRRRVQRVRW